MDKLVMQRCVNFVESVSESIIYTLSFFPFHSIDHSVRLVVKIPGNLSLLDFCSETGRSSSWLELT